MSRPQVHANFGLLPEPERSPASFITSAVVNLTILGLVYLRRNDGQSASFRSIEYEQTELIFPTTPPPPPLKMKMPPPPKVEAPKRPEVKLDAPKINMPKIEKKPDLKPIQMEAKDGPADGEGKPSPPSFWLPNPRQP